MSSDDVGVMREWLKKCKHLPQDIDDYVIKAYLATSKGSLQRAKQTLERGYMIRHTLEFSLGINWDPFSDEMKEALNRITMVCLPKTTPEGYTVWIGCLNKDFPSVPQTSLKGVALVEFQYLTTVWDHEVISQEVIFCFDWSHVQLADITGISPASVKVVLQLLKGSLPYRIKGIYDLNLPPIAEFFRSIVGLFLSTELNSRRRLINNNQDLHNLIPKEILPAEYGGDEPSIFEIYEKTTKEKFRNYRQRLIAQKEQVHAERPFVPEYLKEDTSDTFRKLDID